jgi:hypothetical protein
VPRGQCEATSQNLKYFDSDLGHSKGGRAMSWGAQNRSKDAKTPSAALGMSEKPKLELCGIQPYTNIYLKVYTPISRGHSRPSAAVRLYTVCDLWCSLLHRSTQLATVLYHRQTSALQTPSILCARAPGGARRDGILATAPLYLACVPLAAWL